MQAAEGCGRRLKAVRAMASGLEPYIGVLHTSVPVCDLRVERQARFQAHAPAMI